MSKGSGAGSLFFVDGYDLSGDTNSIKNIGSTITTDDVTGIDKYAAERQVLIQDGGIDWVAYMNPSAGQAHAKLSTLSKSDQIASWFYRSSIGNPTASVVGKQVSYDGTRSDDGKLRFDASVVANSYHLEWGKMLTAGKQTDSAATNNTAIDTTTSLAFGAQAYLHVFSFTGTDVTVKIQDSADNSTFADVTSFAFTEVTSAPTSERIAVTGTIRRYVRAVTVTTGGFSALTYAVALRKNTVAVTF